MTVDAGTTGAEGSDPAVTPAANPTNNFAAGIDLTVLGTPIIGTFEKTELGTRIYVSKSVDTANSEVTVEALLAEVNKLVTDVGISADTINNLLSAVCEKFGVKSMSIKLKMVFLDINMPAKAEGATAPTPKTTVDYAFLLEVATDKHPSHGLLTVNRIVLAVWNTADAAIKKELPDIPPARTTPKALAVA